MDRRNDKQTPREKPISLEALLIAATLFIVVLLATPWGALRVEEISRAFDMLSN